MTWMEVSDVLDEQLKALQNDVPNLHELAHRVDLIPDTLLDYENFTHEILDQAVMEFADTRVWPTLSPVERVMLVFRLEYASSLSFLFATHPPAFPNVVPEPSLDIPDEHLFEWLLICAWHNEGFPTLYDTCERLLRGFAATEQGT